MKTEKRGEKTEQRGETKTLMGEKQCRRHSKTFKCPNRIIQNHPTSCVTQCGSFLCAPPRLRPLGCQLKRANSSFWSFSASWHCKASFQPRPNGRIAEIKQNYEKTLTNMDHLWCFHLRRKKPQTSSRSHGVCKRCTPDRTMHHSRVSLWIPVDWKMLSELHPSGRARSYPYLDLDSATACHSTDHVDHAATVPKQVAWNLMKSAEIWWNLMKSHERWNLMKSHEIWWKIKCHEIW